MENLNVVYIQQEKILGVEGIRKYEILAQLNLYIINLGQVEKYICCRWNQNFLREPTLDEKLY